MRVESLLIMQWYYSHTILLVIVWNLYLRDVQQMSLDNQLVGMHQGDIQQVGSLVVDSLQVGSRHVGDILVVDSLGEGSPHVVEGSVLEDTHLRHDQDVKKALCHLHGVCPSPLFRQQKITICRKPKVNDQIDKK